MSMILAVSVLVVTMATLLHADETPHIALPEGEMGIRAVFAFDPEAAQHMRQLAHHTLYNNESTLSRGERELIATYVSYRNNCHFCYNIHGAAAAHLLHDTALVEAVKKDYNTADISDKMKSLLAIADTVREAGTSVTKNHTRNARDVGATDREIYEAILIAAQFCMYNRLVSGLATPTPTDSVFYHDAGKRIAEHGYVRR